jgi:hypothetical protein
MECMCSAESVCVKMRVSVRKAEESGVRTLPQGRLCANPTAIFATTTPAAWTGARVTNRQEYLLAVPELIQQALRQLGLLGVRQWREERPRHHLA